MITSRSFFPQIHKILSVCQVFSEYVQKITRDSQMKEESTKLDFKIDFKGAQEKRKQILKEISLDLNKIVTSESFASSITEYDQNFSQLLLGLLAKIINEMSNGLGGTRIGNVLYR